jgi:HPt (histidine-containing phosphotransfer) domain-containing protein
MDGYVAKPFSIDDLVRAIGQFVEPAVASTARSRDKTVEKVSDFGVLDVSKLEELRSVSAEAGNPDIVARVVRSYISEASKLLEELMLAIGDGVAKSVEGLAHSIKSSSRQLGLVRVGEVAASLESEGSVGDLTHAEERLDALRFEIERGCLALRAELSKLDAGSASTDGTDVRAADQGDA